MQSQPSPSDVAFAATKEGFSLPVIDVTHPRFAVADNPAAIQALQDAFLEQDRKWRLVPRLFMRMMMHAAARQSRLMRALVEPDAGFLDGLSTYVMKLGPDNLVPPFDQPMDRRLAASVHVPLLRLRMFQTARLVADGLIEDMADAPSAPLHLINIGGGPAIDSLNTLILLKRRRPELLQRPLAIHVLDGDEAGPYFGANALAALMHEGWPLHGLDIAFERRPYDWNAPAPLHDLVGEFASQGAMIAASSEGALFEYGSDEAIVANLQALHAEGRGARLAAGSVTRADMARRRMTANSRLELVPRGLEGFAPLAARAGFTIAQAETAVLSDQVLLRPA
ncbi:hypothetical protein ACFQU1_17345 [Chelatococcus sp. GCM10030263]|uniref:hypothetical protein n=1 Tax=Chelatococcus sp. GCM10030263 TaxID=3273387 RepID=UPI0036165219